MNDIETIMQMTEAYFKGLHEADTKLLRSLFHEDVVLKAPGIRRTREEWLDHVSSRPVPASEGYQYNYKIMSIEIVNREAMVKAYCPLLGNEFIDFLGFLKEDDRWQIVSKMYEDM